jgi:hypothetical protein
MVSPEGRGCCSNSKAVLDNFTFGDKAEKEWIRHRPMLIKGNFYRYLALLLILSTGALWLFTSGVLHNWLIKIVGNHNK